MKRHRILEAYLFFCSQFSSLDLKLRANDHIVIEQANTSWAFEKTSSRGFSASNSRFNQKLAGIWVKWRVENFFY